ncbi:MAG: ATP-binding protein [Patescibacteria group bacterium]
MESSNIPVGYWLLNFKDFHNTATIKDLVKDYADNLNKNYYEGKSICFAGTQGTGKTMASIIILKRAIKNNFSVLYCTAADLFNEIMNSKYDIREKSKNVDFLVIDELDSRFFISDHVKELFSGIYENVFRHRSHNMLPTIICSNETDGLTNMFYGPCIQSIESLNNQYLTVYPIIGTDFRKSKG